MDEAKWTPGPWFVKRTDWRGEPAGHKLYVAGNPYDIPAEDEDGNETDEVAGTGCTAVAIVEGNATSRTTTEANARLMAAAPAMAEALREVLPFVEDLIAADCPVCCGEGSWTNDKPPRMVPVRHKEGCAVVKARAALAAAEA